MRMCKFCVFAGSKKAAYAVRYTKTSHESGHHNEGGEEGGCGRGEWRWRGRLGAVMSLCHVRDFIWNSCIISSQVHTHTLIHSKRQIHTHSHTHTRTVKVSVHHERRSVALRGRSTVGCINKHPMPELILLKRRSPCFTPLPFPSPSVASLPHTVLPVMNQNWQISCL